MLISPAREFGTIEHTPFRFWSRFAAAADAYRRISADLKVAPAHGYVGSSGATGGEALLSSISRVVGAPLDERGGRFKFAYRQKCRQLKGRVEIRQAHYVFCHATAVRFVFRPARGALFGRVRVSILLTQLSILERNGLCRDEDGMTSSFYIIRNACIASE